MWRLIKWLVLIAIIAGIVMWITGYKWHGKTIQEHLKPLVESPLAKEGIKDIRSLVGEGLKAAGEAISEDVTDSERKQLDDLVKKELQMGKPIAGTPNQEALPPAQSGLAKQVEQLKKTAESLKEEPPRTITPR